MDTYFKILSVAFFTAVLILALPQKGGAFPALLTLSACVLALLTGLSFLEPVMRFLRTLHATASIPEDYLRILLKVMAVGISSELACTVCNLSGASALGKTVELLGTFFIVSITVPLYATVLELIQKLVGNL